MLKKIIDYQYRLTEKGKKLEKLRPLASAFDHFCYKSDEQIQKAPFFRDAIDIKRWMFLVIYALIPCLLMAVWNSGVQNLVYTSGNFNLMQSFFQKSTSIKGYFDFCFSELGFWNILGEGLGVVLPIVLTSYIVGGFWEILFACVRGHDINEGFLVTGLLFPLTLPPTIPLWMVAMGISFGVVIGKGVVWWNWHEYIKSSPHCPCLFVFLLSRAYDRKHLVRKLSNANAKKFDGSQSNTRS